MIYDCFSFFNELDLLEIRLNVLKDVVDRFVLVEAGETHAGKPKPFYFEENRSRFAEFLDRIEYVKIEKFPEGCKTAWWRENIQRNAIAEGLKGAKDDDTVLISDLDEIPRPEKIAEFADRPGVKVFDQTYYSFYLNYRNVRQRWWFGTRMLSYRDFLHAFDGVKVLRNEFLPMEINEGTTASKIRCRVLPRSRGGQLIIRNGGWHFTTLGGAAALAKKIVSFAHQEYNPGEGRIDLAELEKMVREGRGAFWEMRCFGVRLDETFPRYIIECADQLSALLFRVDDDYLRRTRARRLIATLKGCAIAFAEMKTPLCVLNALHRLKLLLRD